MVSRCQVYLKKDLDIFKDGEYVPGLQFQYECQTKENTESNKLKLLYVVEYKIYKRVIIIIYTSVFLILYYLVENENSSDFAVTTYFIFSNTFHSKY